MISTSDPIQQIGEICRDILFEFPETRGQCVGVSALLSQRLSSVECENYVALGSLKCRGRLAFKYSGPISSEPGITQWDGHAWVIAANDTLIDLSLLRTAGALPKHSNLRRYLDEEGLLGKGVALMHRQATHHLSYFEKERLGHALFAPAIAGLYVKNGLQSPHLD